jgi:CheY-like chemotaxis protein
MKRVPLSRPSSGGTVLLVDDEPAVRLLLSHILQQAGLQVLAVPSGPEALERFAVAPGAIGLVLLDLNMPGQGGAAVLAALRELRPDVPIVLMSGDAPAEVADRFAGERIAGCLGKPFRSEEMLSLVRAILTGGTRVGP